MADRGSPSERGPLETLALAGLGAFVLAADRADDLADDLASRLGVERSEVQQALLDAFASWRREAQRVGESSSEAAARLLAELGIPTRAAVEELELRVAQLEHRLRLVERG